MSTAESRHPDSAVPNSKIASVRAYDALREEGFSDVTVELPFQTRNTWIVHASCEGDDERTDWRVHIEPRTGTTTLVRRRE